MTSSTTARRFGNLSEEQFVSGMKKYFNINKLDLCDSEEEFNQLSQISLRDLFHKRISDSVIRCGNLAVRWKGLDITITRSVDAVTGVYDGHEVIIEDTGSDGVMKIRMRSAVEWFADMWLYNHKLSIQESQITIRDMCELKGDNFFKFSKFDADTGHFDNAHVRQLNGSGEGLLFVNADLRRVGLSSSEYKNVIEIVGSEVTEVELEGKVVVEYSCAEYSRLVNAKILRSYVSMRECKFVNANISYVRASTREKHISSEIYKVVPVLIPNSDDNIVTLLLTQDGPMVIANDKPFTLGNWYKNEIQNSNNQVAKLAYLAASSFMDTHSDFYKFCGK